MIPAQEVARRVIDACPELNISEKELTAQLTIILSEYRSLDSYHLIGYLPHLNEEDVKVVKKYPCSFCNYPFRYYRGYKEVTTGNYRAFAICNRCSHVSEF